MGIGPTEWILLAILIVLLFGKGKLPGLMDDVAQGIKEFKRGIADDKPSNAVEQKDDVLRTPQ